MSARQPHSGTEAAALLTLARLHGEAGALEQAAAEAARVFANAEDQRARARAALILGDISRARGETSQARIHFVAALAIEEALFRAAPGDPGTARWYARARGRIAELDAAAGAMASAATGAEGALALLRAAAAHIGESPILAADIADAELRLGALELDAGMPASARRRLGEAIGRYEALAVTEKGEPHWRAALSDAWALAGEADHARGAPDQAREAMDKALQARLKLAGERPQERWGLAGIWRVRAALREALGDGDAARDSLAQARALAEQLNLEAAGAAGPARFLVHTLLEQADHALRANTLQAALEAANAARRHAEPFALEGGANGEWLGACAAAWDRLGEIARAAGDKKQTEEAFARVVDLRRRASGLDPASAAPSRALAGALIKYGEAALELGAPAKAREAFNESAYIRLRLAEAAPGEASALRALATALEWLGLAAQALGDMHAARAAWEEELSLAERLFADDDDIEAVRFRAIVEAHLAGAGGALAEHSRTQALARFDALANAGALTEKEARLRRRLWKP